MKIRSFQIKMYLSFLFFFFEGVSVKIIDLCWLYRKKNKKNFERKTSQSNKSVFYKMVSVQIHKDFQRSQGDINLPSYFFRFPL